MFSTCNNSNNVRQRHAPKQNISIDNNYYNMQVYESYKGRSGILILFETLKLYNKLDTLL